MTKTRNVSACFNHAKQEWHARQSSVFVQVVWVLCQHHSHIAWVWGTQGLPGSVHWCRCEAMSLMHYASSYFYVRPGCWDSGTSGLLLELVSRKAETPALRQLVRLGSDRCTGWWRAPGWCQAIFFGWLWWVGNLAFFLHGWVGNLAFFFWSLEPGFLLNLAFFWIAGRQRVHLKDELW